MVVYKNCWIYVTVGCVGGGFSFSSVKNKTFWITIRPLLCFFPLTLVSMSLFVLLMITFRQSYPLQIIRITIRFEDVDNMLFFFLTLRTARRDLFCAVNQWFNCGSLVHGRMVWSESQVTFRVGRFSVHSYGQIVVVLSVDSCVQESDFSLSIVIG